MKKLIAIILSVLLLTSFSPSSFAAVGIKKDGTLSSTATDLNFRSIGNTLTSDGSTATFNLILNGVGISGAVSMTTAQVAVSPSYAFVRKAIAGDSAFSAGTLADGTPGQFLTIFITSVSGGGTFVLTPTTKTGFTTLTFDAAKDQATLLFVDTTTGWVLVSSTSVTVAIP